MNPGGFEVVPVEGESHEGRQWGYVVQSGDLRLHAITGGTGPCWNIEYPDELDTLHVCDLDHLIAALVALRGSEAHREHVARWAS